MNDTLNRLNAPIRAFRYTGREFDTETSLYYYRARYYDPQSGKFIAEDPIRFLGAVSFYPYAQNTPTALVDPFGLKPGDHYPTPDMAAINALNDIANTFDVRTLGVRRNYL
jgi:RHS repeat-associated protein